MKKKIVLIDDDITSLDIIAFLFEQGGFDIERFADGKQAVEYVTGNQPHAVLVDLMMPGINGIQTTDMIRRSGYQGPIIAFTAVDDSEIHAAAVDAGCNEVVTKPCQGKKLIALIERHVSGSQ